MMQEQVNKVIIAGGGTGGHIFPAIAIANALQRMQPEIEILFVGASGKMEMEKVPQAGYKIEGITIAGFDRGNLLKNITLPFKVLKGLRQANKIIDDFQPDVAIGVGGYASFPILYRAQRKGIPTVIQEQNSFAGKANQQLAKKADKIFVAYDGMQKFFPADKLIKTGNPVRKNIIEADVNKAEAVNFFGLNRERKTLFAVGGSLGAKSINEALEADLKAIVEAGVQLIWQTGKLFFEQAKKAAAIYSEQIKVYDFIHDMDKAYEAADVVISRAGAIAIAELAVVKKPVIFVPYPFAAEDHQTHNAQALVQREAALMIANNAAQDKLVDTALELITNEALQQKLTENIKAFGITDADTRIAHEILIIKHEH